MFQQVRPNSPIFILDKGETPSLKVGSVVSVSAPTPRYSTQYPAQPFGTDMVVDVTINVDGEVQELKTLPANLDIANTGANGIVVSDNMAAMCAEVEGFRNASQKEIDTMPYHQLVVSECEKMLARLNPQIAKDKATEERFGKLESQMDGLATNIEKMMGMLGQLGTSKKGDVK